MAMENYRILAGLIAAHPDGKVVGRTRLQKEVKLLQSLGFPTDYSYTVHFYGPYSEGLFSDIGLLEFMGHVTEKERQSRQDGTPYYIITADPEVDKSSVEDFQEEIDMMAKADSVVLELAATYDAFRDPEGDHLEAIGRLRRKKGAKCDEGNEEAALQLLKALGLPFQ